MYFCCHTDLTMKHFKIIISLLLSASFIFIYLFIPNKIIINDNILVKQAGSAVTRGFVQIQYWDKWMPHKSIEGHSFILEKGSLSINASFIASAKAVYTNDDFEAAVTFSAIDGGKDTALIRYEAEIDNRHVSPFTRVQKYIAAQSLKSTLKNIIQAAGAYYGTTKGIYGFDIQITTVKDSSLVSTYKSFPDTPSIQEQYALIDILNKHIQQNNGIVHGDPMVNITRTSNNEVYMQVAIPLAADIPVAGNVQLKKMVLGNILVAKIKGDQQKINKGFEAFSYYISDHLKTSPAIPFVMYHTNRLQELDANKWESTIYYPIY